MLSDDPGKQAAPSRAPAPAGHVCLEFVHRFASCSSSLVCGLFTISCNQNMSEDL